MGARPTPFGPPPDNLTNVDDSAAANPEQQPDYPQHWEADILLRDGGTARIRPIAPADAGRLVEFYEQVSDQSKYFRFFAPYPRLSAKDVRRFTHHDFVNRVGLAVVIRDHFIATVRYDRIDAQGRPSDTGTDAEVAFLVQDAHQGRGVASALLEHIAAVAQERGIRRFQAEVLPENRKMVKVFTDAGYTQHRSFADGVVHLEFDLEQTERSLAVMRAREHRAEARSVQRLLTPRSVAVLGVSRNPQTVGRAILRDLLGSAPAERPVYAVNRNAPPGTELDGVPVHRSILDIPGPVDLAVIAVPEGAVPAAVAECGAHGVQGLVVVTAGYAETGPEGRDRQRALVRQARAAGMRVIGPNAFGLINTDPEYPLNASLAPRLPVAAASGSSASPARSGWRCWRPPTGAASASPPSPRWATAPPSPATTSCSTGRRTRPPGWCCSTWSPSAIRASSPGSPAAWPPSSRSWWSRAPGTPAACRPGTPSRPPPPA